MVVNVVPLIPWDAIFCFFNAPEILEEKPWENPIDSTGDQADWLKKIIQLQFDEKFMRTFSYQNFSYLFIKEEFLFQLEIDLCDLTSFFLINRKNHEVGQYKLYLYTIVTF